MGQWVNGEMGEWVEEGLFLADPSKSLWLFDHSLCATGHLSRSLSSGHCFFEGIRYPLNPRRWFSKLDSTGYKSTEQSMRDFNEALLSVSRWVYLCGCGVIVECD